LKGVQNLWANMYDSTLPSQNYDISIQNENYISVTLCFMFWNIQYS